MEYKISLKERMNHAMSWSSPETVSGLDELKKILDEKGVKSVDLEYLTPFDDDVRSHKLYLKVYDIVEEDLVWLAEDVDYASRSLTCSVPRKV